MKTGRRTEAVKRARIPAWIQDKANQAMWNDKFIRKLKKNYENLDTAIALILGDQQLSQLCVPKIIDPHRT